jgi:TonB dependent receptor/Carboxypeptidase regulatory-like domain/TonB-dependent Receptor Plug Domain
MYTPSYRGNSWFGRMLLFSILAIVLFALQPAFAQETTAGLMGTVKDQSGAVVPNATVEVSGTALLGTQKSVTDSTGQFTFAKLPVGTYTISVSASGFSTYKRSGIELSAGRLPSIEVQLKLGAQQEVVEVTSEAPMVDVTQSKVATSVSREILDSIPTGRSFQSVIPFAPGARQEPLQAAPGNRGNGFQIDGASDSENVFMMDGMNTTDIQNGGVGKNFQTDFIQEVQVKTSSFEAEFGGALGGVINAVPKRGSNEWHGAVLAYLQTNALNANDPCASGLTSGGNGTNPGNSAVCGLRLDPTKAGLSGTKRLDGTPQYYVPRKDDRRILEPGFEIGGPLLKNRLWLFTGYVPTIDTIRRLTTFTGLNPGPRTLTSTFTQHNAFTRLDYRMFDQLRLFASWNYADSRTTGTLGVPDSAYGQLNTGASTDPNTLRADNGSVNPLSVYTFGGDWTPTSKLVISARYGYFFNNNEQRGHPVGIRYAYLTGVVANNGNIDPLTGKPLSTDPNAANYNPCTLDITGVCMSIAAPSAVNTAGFANIPGNLTTLFESFKRKSFNTDVSYFVGKFFGTHTFKAGYFHQIQSNDVFINFNTANINLTWGSDYQPVTGTSACNAVIAQNVANGWPGLCQGKFGYFTVGTNVTNSGADTQSANALYFQDAWTVGHGLTLNLGIRFDQEKQPPYDPKRFPTVEFGWGQKIAPRIGGAYDLLHNGKVKIYASYGQFFDIMKMGLARGSFGSDYWHNCVYAMDFTDPRTITPTGTIGGGCPASGPAPGVTVGRFIENVDFRATKADPRDPAINPATLKPMQQHEFVTGVDWAINPNWSLETRYSRKRLDQTIEDMAITDDLGFYIGNPGSTIADVLHRPVVIDSTVGPVGPFCAECPPTLKAIRRFDGVEFRLTKRPTGKWFGAVTYTYSKLRGNYAGLTNTDPTDGGGGRHAPNNGRAFDIPTMTYLPNGKIDDGPLATDRPHTANIFGFYRQKWAGMETTLGFTQSLFQGTPLSTCLPVVGTGSSCQWAEGRGNFVKFTRDAVGNLVNSGVVKGARTDAFFQTDFNITHQIHVSKTNEARRLIFEANIFNVLNQRSAVGFNEIAIAGLGLIAPWRASRFTGDPGIDWNKIMTGYNYVDAVNGTGAFAGKIPGTTTNIQAPLTLASRYGLPNVFQGARNMRLAIRFTF